MLSNLPMPKTRRNDLCPCGSGLKFKKCHGGLAKSDPQIERRSPPLEILHLLERHRADERIRQEQQGLGRPIVAFKAHGHQVVAVGSTLHYSRAWKTFPDFLADFIKRILDPSWGKAELAKPFEQRHPLIQWYDAFCRYQQATINTPGQPAEARVTGVVACYLGLAYNLYLLQHNVELQDRLVRRLKNSGTFQGAYYELIVANILIRAGFELTLEDETDGASKHCEFAAVSKLTGKKYWVEAKMRVVPGYFGKTAADASLNHDPISRLIPHLNSALAKPAADDRLIFIDLNTDATSSGTPPWIERAAGRLEQYEKRELASGVQAYVFVTNFPFHRALNDSAAMAGFPFGLGIGDFNRPGVRRVSDAYRIKRKHIDAHNIGEALGKYLKWPATFDGSLPSESIANNPSRIIVGETYCFGDPEKGGIVGTVTFASVNEEASEVWIAVTDDDGVSQLLKEPMSPAQLADFRAHRDSYFGRVLPVARKITDPFEMFEWFVERQKDMSRQQLLNTLAHATNITALQTMSDEDLLYEYCELMVSTMNFQNAQKVS